MKNSLHRIIISILLLCFFPFTLQGAENSVPASLSVLVEESPERDGKAFIIQGELVGEPLLDGKGVWLNILEEGNPMAVFCPAPLASMATQLAGGNHGRVGNRIRVAGILRRICPDHGGDLDFHAEICEITSPTQATPDLPKPWETILLSLIILTSLVVKIRSVIHSKEAPMKPSRN